MQLAPKGVSTQTFIKFVHKACIFFIKPDPIIPKQSLLKAYFVDGSRSEARGAASHEGTLLACGEALRLRKRFGAAPQALHI